MAQGLKSLRFAPQTEAAQELIIKRIRVCFSLGVLFERQRNASIGARSVAQLGEIRTTLTAHRSLCIKHEHVAIGQFVLGGVPQSQFLPLVNADGIRVGKSERGKLRFLAGTADIVVGIEARKTARGIVIFEVEHKAMVLDALCNDIVHFENRCGIQILLNQHVHAVVHRGRFAVVVHDVAIGRVKDFRNQERLVAAQSGLLVEHSIDDVHRAVAEHQALEVDRVACEILVERLHGIQAETVHAAPQPKVHNLAELADELFTQLAAGEPVEVGLLRMKKAEVVGATLPVPKQRGVHGAEKIFPTRAVEIGRQPTIVQHLPGVAEPRVFHRSVIQYQIHQDLDTERMSGGNELRKSVEAAKAMVDSTVVADVVTVIVARRRIDWREPNIIGAECLDTGEMLGHLRQAARPSERVHLVNQYLCHKLTSLIFGKICKKLGYLTIISHFCLKVNSNRGGRAQNGIFGI